MKTYSKMHRHCINVALLIGAEGMSYVVSPERSLEYSMLKEKSN